MPVTAVNLGFQAVILCGAGQGLYPFTQAEDVPKALLPLANRPMIYYALDWCEKAGVQCWCPHLTHLPITPHHRPAICGSSYDG